MADRPIIFSAPMIAALLAGRKTQTRRILKPEPATSRPREGSTLIHEGVNGSDFHRKVVAHFRPRFAVGDRLWVRENHQFRGASYNDGTEGDPNWSEDEWFRVWGCGGPGDSWDPKFPSGWSPSVHMGVHDLTGPEHSEGPDVRGFATKVLPSIHMPRWASRLTLLVTDVRVGRLQDISAADARAEGIFARSAVGDDPHANVWTWQQEGWRYPHPTEAFKALWSSIHGPEAWADNAWLVAISFTVHARNIDQLAPIAEVAA